MKNQLLALTVLSSLSATLAMADVVDTKVQDLYTQGYTHFEVARGTVKSQIEAYAPNGTKMVVVLDNQSGASVAEQVFQGSASDFNSAASNIAAIYYEQSDTYQTNGGIPDASTGLSNDGLGHVENSNYIDLAGNNSYDSDSNESYSSGGTESYSSGGTESYSSGGTESYSSGGTESYSSGGTESYSGGTESYSNDSNESHSSDSHGSDDHGDDD